MYEKILLAFDGSKDSIRTARKVIELQKKWNSKVVAFYSIEHHLIDMFVGFQLPIGPGFYTNVPRSYKDIQIDYKIEGEKILDYVKKMFNNEGIPLETRLIKDEDPEDYIERIVEEENFDLVALGCRGNHSKLKRIFNGSVAQKVLNDAPCNVLIVR
ncbi:MAG: universal stress protein [Candidatus Hodarchaeota archaeon]